MATISGVVKDASGTPCQAVVDVTRRDSGILVARVLSDQTTGAYSVTTADTTMHVVKRYVAPVIAGNPDWANQVLGLYMDDTGLTDVRGHAITLNGSVSRSAAQVDRGAYSAAFSGGYLSTPSSSDFNFGTGDFTIRGRFYLNNAATYQFILGNSVNSDSYFMLAFNHPSGEISIGKAGVSWLTSFGAHGISSSTWVDVEVTRSGSSNRCFINGTQTATTVTDSTNWSMSNVWVGQQSGGTALSGYIDDFEIYKGVALHTSNFTPATSVLIGDYTIDTPTEDAQIFDYVTPV